MVLVSTRPTKPTEETAEFWTSRLLSLIYSLLIFPQAHGKGRTRLSFLQVLVRRIKGLLTIHGTPARIEPLTSGLRWQVMIQTKLAYTSHWRLTNPKAQKWHISLGWYSRTSNPTSGQKRLAARMRILYQRLKRRLDRQIRVVNTFWSFLIISI